MKKITFLIFVLFAGVVFAQKITVLDKETQFEIPDVVISNQDKSKNVTSDVRGDADLSVFDDYELLFFDHISYEELEITKEKALKKGKVYLKSNLKELDEVILSASRGKESRKRIAEQVEVISLREIQQQAPQTSADMLAEVPGIKVQKSQFGGGSPVLRGMEANRVLLVVDGVRMNNAIYRRGHLQNSITVSPNMLERTEVVFGPSSVIYGSDALGGVVHYYTKTPKTNEKTTINPSFLGRYSTVNNERTVNAGLELQFKKFATYTSISHSTFEDLKMGKNRTHGFEHWGKVTAYSSNSDTFFYDQVVKNNNSYVQRNTGYDQTDFLQKFFIPLTEKTDITFNLQYGESSNIPRFDRLTELTDETDPTSLKFAEWYYGPQKRLLASSQLKINPEKSWLKNGTITAAYQNIEESRVNRKFGSLNKTYRAEKLDVYSLNGDFFTPLTQDNTRILSYGAEFTHNDATSIPKGEKLKVEGNQIIGVEENFTVQARYADGGSKYTSLAGYANYRQDISKKSTLNTGIRLTTTYLQAKWLDQTFIQLPDTDIKNSNSAVTATLGFVHKPTENWQLNGVISSGFRSPNIDDVGKVREKNGYVTVPNINLKPEYAYNAEIGLLRYFNKKRSYVNLVSYYTLLDNYITRDFFSLNGSSTILFDGEEGTIVANVNKKNAYVVGGTFNFKTRLNDYFHTKGSITYTKGKAYDTGDNLSSIPPLFGNLIINFVKGRFETGFNFRFNGKKSIADYNLIEGIDNQMQTPIVNINTKQDIDKYYGTPSWYTLNLNAKYRISRNFDFLVNLDNLLDTHYKEFASAISAPGRNLSVTVLANF